MICILKRMNYKTFKHVQYDTCQLDRVLFQLSKHGKRHMRNNNKKYGIVKRR